MSSVVQWNGHILLTGFKCDCAILNRAGSGYTAPVVFHIVDVRATRVPEGNIFTYSRGTLSFAD